MAKNLKTCPRCEGTGEVDDDPHGTGIYEHEPCDECGGDGEIEEEDEDGGGPVALRKAHLAVAEELCKAFDACETIDPVRTESDKQRLWGNLVARHKAWLAVTANQRKENDE